jgi:hypothetical protein
VTAAALAEAAGGYGDLGLRFDQARTLLQLERSLCRSNTRGDARRALENAGSRFERAWMIWKGRPGAR